MHTLNLFENDFYGIFPEFFLIGATLCLLLFGSIWSTSRVHGSPYLIEPIAWLGVFCLGCSLFLLWNSPCQIMVLFYNTLVVDEFRKFIKTVILCSAAASLLMSLDYLKTEKIYAFEYVILVLFSTCSMCLMVSSYDFVSMYLAIEMQSLCFYVLAASKQNSEFSTEAGLKYFLLGAFASGILLFGCSLIYGATGVTNIEACARLCVGLTNYEASLQFTMCSIGVICLAIGLLFKLTAAPFHFWAPDVYEGAPTSVTAFFSITPKIAILGLFIRIFLFGFADLLFIWQPLVLFCSICSLIVGAFGAMAQKKIKRLLVYSSIGHIGFILLGVACATPEGLQAVLLYTFIYVIMRIHTFSVILSLRTEKDGQRIVYIQDLGALSSTHPWLAASFSLTLFSMAGIPPLAGFCSKFAILLAALDASYLSFTVFGILMSTVSCFYYIRLIKIMYFEKPSHDLKFQTINPIMNVLLMSRTAFIFGFGFMPQFLINWTGYVANSFFGLI